MNRASSLHTRRIARRFLFVVAVPLGVFATAAHAHTLEQAQPPSPDTIAKQFPAVPSTKPAAVPTTLPRKLAQTDQTTTTTTVLAATTETVAEAQPVDATAPAESAPTVAVEATPLEGLAETGLMSPDVLFAGLALLALGSGFMLGVDTKATASASPSDR